MWNFCRVVFFRANVVVPSITDVFRGLERYYASLSMWSTISLAQNFNTVLGLAGA